jgi:hypothetical protein
MSFEYYSDLFLELVKYSAVVSRVAGFQVHIFIYLWRYINVYNTALYFVSVTSYLSKTSFCVSPSEFFLTDILIPSLYYKKFLQSEVDLLH